MSGYGLWKKDGSGLPGGTRILIHKTVNYSMDAVAIVIFVINDPNTF